ncbi:ethyl acetate hydrolase-like [Mytilus trossulus]|uniref:ethyl acetate hydrolase-like n=1 Tax=Mytilus trossulus TaxID=6551 RepID=UPI003003F3C6
MTTLEILEELQSKYFIHPETFDFFKKRTEHGFTKAYFDVPISEARESNLRSAKLFSGSVDFDGTTRELNIPSKDIKDGIPVTVYKPATCRNDPSIFVYFHGGGNCVGSRAGVDTVCKILSRDSGCIVVNVEYRLAPEFKFPSNHEDVLCVVRWVKGHKEELGIFCNCDNWELHKVRYRV